MSTESRDPEEALRSLAERERRQRLFSSAYLVIVLSIGAAMTLWSAQQAKALNVASRQLRELRGEIASRTAEVESLRTYVSRVSEAGQYVRLGLEKHRRGDYAGAITAYEQAIALDHSSPLVFDLKGYSHFRHQEYEAAVEAGERSIALAPEYVWGHYDLALAYWAVGKKDDAVAQVRKVLELAPTFRDVIRSDGQFAAFRSEPAFRDLMSH